MGQRTFRGQFVDNLARDYMNTQTRNPKKKESSLNFKFSSKKEDEFSSSNAVSSSARQTEQLIDLDYEFDLNNPFDKIKEENLERVRKGILNFFMSGNKRINKLNLTIKTHLNENQVYQNLNLHLLFGIYFFKDINSINITIKDKEGNIQDNKEIISNIMEYMVFKSKLNVVVNSKFIYYVKPAFKDHSLILSYKTPPHADVNSKEDSEEFIDSLLKDFLGNQYLNMKASFTSIQQSKLALSKTFPSGAKNLILPYIELTDYTKEKEGLISYFKFLSSKFKLVSIEFIIKDKNADVSQILEDISSYLHEFDYIIISFNINTYEIKPLPNNAHLLKSKLKLPSVEENKLIERAKNYLYSNKLEKVAITEHFVRQTIDNKTLVFENVNFYQYVYYNRKLSEKISTMLFAVKKNKKTRKLRTKRPIIDKMLQFIHGKDYSNQFYVKGKCDYSTEVVKNTRVVTF